MTKKIDIFKLATGLRCKPGDLAIVGGGAFPENLGLIVEVLSPDVAPRVPGDTTFLWFVRSVGRHFKAQIPGETQTQRLEQASSPDNWLTPITGLPLEELAGTDMETPA